MYSFRTRCRWSLIVRLRGWRPSTGIMYSFVQSELSQVHDKKPWQHQRTDWAWKIYQYLVSPGFQNSVHLIQIILCWPTLRINKFHAWLMYPECVLTCVLSTWTSGPWSWDPVDENIKRLQHHHYGLNYSTTALQITSQWQCWQFEWLCW